LGASVLSGQPSTRAPPVASYSGRHVVGHLHMLASSFIAYIGFYVNHMTIEQFFASFTSSFSDKKWIE